MMNRFAVFALLLAACVEADDGVRKAGDDLPAWTNPNPTNTGISTTPTDPETIECAFEPTEPIVPYEIAISTEEDFAFDGAGRVVFQSGSALVAATQKGSTYLVSPNAPADPSGLAMRSRSELVVAAPDTGSLSLVDVITGGVTTVAGGLDQPNGVTTGWDGLIYVSERVAGRVSWIDPDTGTSAVIAQDLMRPNGLALTEDEQTLYIATEDGIYAVDRVGDWEGTNTPQLIHAHDEATFVGTVAVDLCGFVYSVDYVSGQILRIDPDRGESILLADLNAGASFGFGALHFGNGNGWPRGHLFTSNRRVMTGLDVGIAGVLSPAAIDD